MDDATLATLAESWIKLQSLPPESAEAGSLMGASIELDLLCLNEPKECWAVIKRILASTNDDWVITNLAAGPIESLLAQHGEKAVVWMEHEARNSSRFRELLAGVWRNMIPEDVWRRVQSLR